MKRRAGSAPAFAALALTAWLNLTGCGPSEEASPEATVQTGSSGIIGGTIDTGDPAVVAFAAHQNGIFEVFCSGTLIRPQTVLTAAHCLYAYGQSAQYHVHFGVDANAPIATTQVVSQIRHPYYSGNGYYDIAVLKLLAPVTDVTPIPINTAALSTSFQGSAIRHVGFGASSFSSGTPVSDGSKRQVTTLVRQVNSWLLEIGASGPTRQTCFGDSGGPGLMTTPGSTTERVAGVAALADAKCEAQAWDTRVDIFASWIRQTYGAWEQPECIQDGLCRTDCSQPDIDCLCAADNSCTSACTDPALDPDCPADCGGGNNCSVSPCPIPDPDCLSEGSACVSPSQCRGQRCISDAQHPDEYCSRDCTTTLECPAGMRCNFGICNFVQKPTRSPLSSCVVTRDFCLDGTSCLGQIPTETTACYYPCSAQGSCVLAGQFCVRSPDGTKFCRTPLPRVVRGPVSYERATLEGPAAPQGCSGTGGGAMLVALLALLPLRRRRVV